MEMACSNTDFRTGHDAPALTDQFAPGLSLPLGRRRILNLDGGRKTKIQVDVMETKGDLPPQQLRAIPRRVSVLLLSLGTLFVLVVATVTVKLLKGMRNEPAAAAYTPGTPMNDPAPGFTLRDQNGRPTSLRQFRGKVVVLTFIDPVCTQLCPLTTRSMVGALQILGPAAAAHVQLLAVDANPQKTQVSDVANYTRIHELEGRWRFLTGPVTQLESIWKDYHVYVAVEKNDIFHTAVVMLIDGNGHERNVISTPMSYNAEGDQAQTLAAAIAELLPSHPAVAAPPQTAGQPDEPPGGIANVNLTALGPGKQPVVLGSKHPHLLLFFAGWMGKGNELQKDLAALDSYGALARKRGWPSPVAVDILPTEPSAAEARQVLEPLATRLHTPIVQDSSGALADDYQVNDLPWLVLNTASGQILWHHDGWLSGAGIARQVRAALAAGKKKPAHPDRTGTPAGGTERVRAMPRPA